ncbi:MAG: hypothetical protein NT128_07720 [Proteobacteria bacterium]|nr:hypothetical protein [Pseudomonadota bacterium]
MKSKSIYLTFCVMIISVFSCHGFAADSGVDLPGFKEAGFRVQSLAALKESGNPFHKSLVDFYKGSGAFADRVFVVADYPKAAGKTEANYAPLRPKATGTEILVPFDTVVLSRYNGTDDGAHLSRILTSWIATGFSSHAVVTLEGAVVYWVNPILCKGQMAGKWNNTSVEVLVATDAGHCLVGPQVYSIASIVGFANAFVNAEREPIRFMLSHGEARGSKEEGTIANLDDVRGGLKLSNANKEHDQAPLSK